MSIILLFDEIAALINRLNVVGVQPDQFKLLVHFLLCFPLSIALRYISQHTVRKVFILFWGAFFMLYLGAQWIGLVLAQTLTIYAIAKKIKKPFMSITILSFIILGYLHYDRITNADASWKMGFNVVQMMLTCRFVYVAAAAEDGLQFNFLDYVSYIFYYPNIIVGTVPFKAYVEFINLTGIYNNLGHNFRAAFISLLKALLFVAGTITYMLAEQLIKPKFSFAYFASQEFEQGTLLWKHIACQIIAWCERFKYFLAFKFSQAAMDAQGITYDGQNFNNHSLANYRFEIEFSPIKRTKHWNSSVQTWLQTCFYERFTQQKILLTFALSAYWHGFFIVYYVFFIEWAVFNEITKQVYRARNKFTFIPKWIQSVLICVFGQLAVNSTATPVGLLQWEKVYKAMSDLGWVAQITMIVLYGFFKLSKWGKTKVN